MQLEIITSFAALVRVRGVLKTSPLAMEKMMAQFMSCLVDRNCWVAALCVCGRLAQLLQARIGDADGEVSGDCAASDTSSFKDIQSFYLQCTDTPSAACHALLRCFPPPGSGIGDSGTATIAAACACTAARCMIRLQLCEHAVAFSLGTGRLWTVRLLRMGTAALTGSAAGATAAAGGPADPTAAGKGASSATQSAAERAVLSAWRYREQL